jgi:hypothetical protein
MKTRRAMVALSVAAVVALAPAAAFARHGADDPKGHDAGDARNKVTRVVDRMNHDDSPGDDHGRGLEPGDDHGRGLEPGDDHGGR